MRNGVGRNGNSSPMTRRTLLVMDDEPAIAALIQRAGERCGFDAMAASDFEAFKGALNAKPPDLICLDLTMPDADGIEVLRYLADRRCQASILIISGFDRQIVQSAMRLGQALGLRVVGTIPKPIQLAALKKMLSQHGCGQSDPAAP